MAKLDDAQRRSAVIAERIRQRTDVALRRSIANFEGELSFLPLPDLMISEEAWTHVTSSDIDPKLVFAHPDLLRQNPRASQYYRGIALLPRKRVAEIAGAVDSWEDETRRTILREPHILRVARLYNAVISSIIEGSNGWTLDNGYRNIIANMGIGLDGTVRNLIGQDAERLIKGRIKKWLDSQQLIVQRNVEETQFELPGGYSMRYGSEPDIEFSRRAGDESTTVATIEIKGGKDPAGALERLGAIQKSFEATPPGCVNMLIAGIITSEMRDRLNRLGIGKTFLLDDLAHDGDPWAEFLNEVFHYTVRITAARITMQDKAND